MSLVLNKCNIHKYNLKIFAIFIKNVFGCYIYMQTVKIGFTRCFSFVNLFAFVCELVCIYVDFIDS